ncbi:hypothetical protein D9M68_297920 [compost metagenome]
MSMVQAGGDTRQRLFSTDELAAEIKVRSQSIRKRYCQTGSYWGLRPVKLPSGRLLWPADSIEQLMGAR